ncbi:MAG: murein hydrolase activator EnvC family protein [Eubacteriaceae bacterium]|jgi:murein DD-endopeptidase MepM/ murein hydrolase activator NlpD
MTRRLISILTILILVFSCAVPVFADELSDRQSKISELQQKVNTTNAKVQDLNKQIAEKEAQIASTQAELDQAEAKRADQETELRERLRVIYMYGNEGYLEMFFTSQDLTELFSYLDISKDIMQADITAQNNLTETRKQIEESKQKLEEDKAAIEAAKKESKNAQNDLAQELENNKDLVAAIEQQIADQQAAALAAQQAADADQNANTQTEVSVYDNSSFYNSPLTGSDTPIINATPAENVVSSGWTWPIDAGATNAFLITSLMGTRESPGGIGSSNHGGNDIGAAYGSTIVAAQSGTVSQSGWNDGYGNCVTIETDDGYTTMYGHMSSISVAKGTYVTAGQAIGYVGSTGWSTGPHLHFEVRSGGTKINGLQFYGDDILNRLSYALDA